MRRVTSTPPSRNDKVVLTNSANQVCLNVPWIFHQHTISLHCRVPYSRDFVHWRFSDAGRRSAWIASSCRRPKTCTEPDIPPYLDSAAGGFNLLGELAERNSAERSSDRARSRRNSVMKSRDTRLLSRREFNE